MKRYYDYCDGDMRESDDGEWVRYEEAGPHIERLRDCVQEQTDLIEERDVRILRLRKALNDLVTAHNGYQHGMGPCICVAHENARKVLSTFS